MPEKKRTVQDVRTELGDFLETLVRSSNRAGRAIKAIDVVTMQPAVRNAIEIVAQQIQSIQQSLPSLSACSHELYLRAITDGLTRLLNRGYFEEVIKPAIEQHTQTAIILTDIDRFHRYNDTYGHQQGDKALQTVAECVQQCAQTPLVARYGGEEFSILAEYANRKHDVFRVAENIRTNVEQTSVQPFSLEAVVRQMTRSPILRRKLMQFFQESVGFTQYSERLSAMFPKDKALHQYVRGLQHVTISVGAAVRAKDETAGMLIYRADKALYQAKHKGRNCVVLAKTNI